MKGQSINLNWVIGTIVFLTALVFSITYTFNSFNERESQAALQEELKDIRDNFKDLTEVEIRQAPLNVRGPNSGYKIPVKQSFVFSGDTQVAVLNTPYELNKSKEIFRTVVDAGNNSYRLTEFQKDVDTESFENDIETGIWLNNSKLAVKPEGEGLESISLDNTNLLRNYTTFDSTEYSVEENEIYGETLGGSLEMYNGSSELIIDSDNSNNHLMKNFTDLYWSNGSETISLTGRADIKSGKTEGLLLHGLNGNDYGVVWTGLSDVNVSKPDNRTVNVSMENNYSYRLRAYEGSLEEGKDRTEFARKGNIVVGAKNEFEAVSIPEMNKISAWQDFKVENELGISNIGYNITYGQFISKKQVSSSDSRKELNEGEYDGSTADKPGSIGSIGIGYLNGSNSNNGIAGDELEHYWRLDKTSGNFSDYSSGNTYDASNEGATRGDRGVFGTNALNFTGNSGYVNAGPTEIIGEITLSTWVKFNDLSSSNQRLVEGSYDGSDTAWELKIGAVQGGDDDKLRFQSYDGTAHGVYVPISELREGEWQHIVGTYTGSTWKIYVNGTDLSDTTYNTGTGAVANTEDKYIGCQSGGSGCMEGMVDEVKLYDRSLSSEEIESLYFNGKNRKYYGNYTKSFKNSLKVTWNTLKADVSGIDSDTSLKVDFTAIGEDGNEKKTETFDLSNGPNRKSLNTPDTEKAKIRFYGSSENVTKTWKLDDFNVTYSDNKRGRVEKGRNIPFQNVEISSETFPMVESDGDVETLRNQIAVWR